ncbi:MAG: DUF2970 domain-containing protein [Tepidimonas sp.]|uniref:DUF2970 domain-containing protein n=1 Tax=Tepidimonas sp. TaxID=2002775 RepID=UPI00259F472A|nr:DUF2970 domain-containing protein [Tepidimonas sp.]MDM7457325.1 DUF2970 domain-containing protein [Tepidimonas sp.]
MTPSPHQRPVAVLDTVKAVLWSFIGLRRRADFENDVQKLNPVAVLVTAVVMTFVFIAILMLIVRWVVSS